MPQMWVYVLAILLLSASQVRPLSEERDAVGTCRYDQTSVAVFSCIRPDGKWRPPSATCCNALLYAVDHLPAGAESGACCLCRYMRAKHVPPGLATSYVLCQGKDSNAVTRWSSFPITSCSRACGRRNDASAARKDPPADSSTSKILWTVASVAICVTLLVCWWWWYWWWVTRAADAPPPSGRGSSSPESDHSRISSSGLRASAQLKERRMSSSRSSPNS